MQNISKLGLGTVQWGKAYGISNREGKTSQDEVKRILLIAQSNDIKLLDTAPSYGDSELILGKRNLRDFKIVTKTEYFKNNTISNIDKENLISTFMNSMLKLSLDSIDGLLIHDVNDLFKRGGEDLVDGLKFLKDSGLVKKIGITIYDSQQINSSLQIFKPDIVQLPINVFDQRLIKDGTLKKLSELNIEIHARSIFLQGLLFIKENNLPEYFSPWKNKISDWHYQCKINDLTPLSAALNFILGLPEVNHCLVGVNSAKQLQEIIVASKKNIFFDKDFATDDEKLINPKNWC
tara:strand:- start:709 stop:1584 length:876 start_codon:yes stop_codon:yes gene_type:complete